MTMVLAPGAVCVIPEMHGGLPVTELADRALARQDFREVYLPKTLRRIGRYGFYNCEKLEVLHFYAETREIGGGIFNGCRKIRELYIHMGTDERSALRDFVTEITGRLVVHYYVPDSAGGASAPDVSGAAGTPGGSVCEREAARLVFPEYYDEAIENTPARNLSFSIHGSGQKYRYCFGDRRIRFELYDKVFVHEVIEESTEDAAEIAVNRLMFPHGLWEEAKVQYMEFLDENFFEIMEISLRDTERFQWLMDRAAGKLSEEELEQLILKASSMRLAQVSGVLMDFRHRQYPPKKKKFVF